MSIRRLPRIGSGTVIVVTAGVVALVLLLLGNVVGWVRAWYTFAVPSMLPPFRDMHAVTDHAACFAKGFNAYFPNPCDPLRTPFNYPPPWLWLGYLGINSDDTFGLSVLMAIVALAVLVMLMRGRSITAGALTSLAIVAPSVLLGVERGNVDLFIFALVGGAALLVARQHAVNAALGTALLALAVVLKLYPVFCMALAAKFSRRNLIIAAALGAASAIYFLAIYNTMPIISNNTQSTFFASYGYKVPFMGVDALLRQGGLPPTGLPAAWTPLALAMFTLALAATVALHVFRGGRCYCVVADNAAGVAFLFCAGIYCGSFMLGANFAYRLTFLLLCMPQVLDWLASTFPVGDRTLVIARLLLIGMFGALWLNIGMFGPLWFNTYHIFVVTPQVFDWALLFGLMAVLAFNFLCSVSEAVTR